MSDISEDMTRREIAHVALLAFATVVVLVALYYVVPIPRHRAAIWWRLLLGLSVFALVLVHELRAILRNRAPVRRAVIAFAVVVPLFITTFAYLYLIMSRSDPGTFAGAMSRTQSLYFTISVFSTVGFGDITPKTDPARLVTSMQMMLDLVVIGVVIRLILGAASRATSQRPAEPSSAP